MDIVRRIINFNLRLPRHYTNRRLLIGPFLVKRQNLFPIYSDL